MFKQTYKYVLNENGTITLSLTKGGTIALIAMVVVPPVVGWLYGAYLDKQYPTTLLPSDQASLLQD